MVAAPENTPVQTNEKVENTEKPIEKPVMAESEEPMEEVKELTKEEKEEKLAQCTDLMKNGRKFLIQSKPQEAVAALADGLAIMRQFNGELDVAMCEFYFYYGKALLDVARIEDGVLGNALKGVPEGDDADNSQVEDPDKLSPEEREEVAQKVDEALEENLHTMETKQEEKAEVSDAKDSEDKTETKEDEDSKEDKDSAVDKTTTDEKESEEKEGADEGETKEENDEEEIADDDAADSQEDDEEEDVPSIQLAFEVLDLARVIYTQQKERSREESLKLSQVYLKLGEVAMENENFEDAVAMLKDCLELQKSMLTPDDRWLAETHYQLGAAYTMASDFDSGLQHANSAVEVIQCRIDSRTQALEKEGVKMSAELDVSSLSEDNQAVVKELKELETLLPELKEKIVDIQASKDSTKKQLQSLMSGFSAALGGSSSGKSAFEDASGASSSGASPKAVSATLIRKKRKPEDEVAAEEAKKQKTDEAST